MTERPALSSDNRVDLPQDADPAIFAPGLRWWRTTAARLGRLPGRPDLSPLDLTAPALPHVIMTDIGADAVKLRFRLVGTAHVTFNQRDFTGLDFGDVYPPDSPVLRYVRGLYRLICAERRPLWSVNEVPSPRTNQMLVMRRLMLPLAANGVDVDLSVAIQTVEYSRARDARLEHPWHTASQDGERARLLL